MAKGNPFENYSEYVPPTSPPKARVPKADMQSVKLDPAIDRRLARTQISHRQKKRLSRKYTLTAFIAGALGALAATLVYVFFIAKKAAPETTTPAASVPVEAPQREVAASRAVRTPAPVFASTSGPAAGSGSQEEEEESRGESQEAASSVAPRAASPAPAPPERAVAPPRAAVPARPKPPERAVEPVKPPEPPPEAEVEAVKPDPAPPLEAPAASPEPTASSKVWVDTPPRKVWVQ